MFSAYERTVAFRYLRARRQEGFISLTVIISLVGIALGVATLIVVMAVMNGFRAELFERVLGLNGHIAVMARDRDLSARGHQQTGQQRYQRRFPRPVRSQQGAERAFGYLEGNALQRLEGPAFVTEADPQVTDFQHGAHRLRSIRRFIRRSFWDRRRREPPRK